MVAHKTNSSLAELKVERFRILIGTDYDNQFCTLATMWIPKIQISHSKISKTYKLSKQ